MQGLAFVMLLAGRIDARILRDANALKMTRKELLSLFSFLRLTDNKKSVSIHNQKAKHAEDSSCVYNFDTCCVINSLKWTLNRYKCFDFKWAKQYFIT